MRIVKRNLEIFHDVQINWIQKEELREGPSKGGRLSESSNSSGGNNEGKQSRQQLGRVSGGNFRNGAWVYPKRENWNIALSSMETHSANKRGGRTGKRHGWNWWPSSSCGDGYGGWGDGKNGGLRCGGSCGRWEREESGCDCHWVCGERQECWVKWEDFLSSEKMEVGEDLYREGIGGWVWRYDMGSCPSVSLRWFVHLFTFNVLFCTLPLFFFRIYITSPPLFYILFLFFLYQLRNLCH